MLPIRRSSSLRGLQYVIKLPVLAPSRDDSVPLVGQLDVGCIADRDGWRSYLRAAGVRRGKAAAPSHPRRRQYTSHRASTADACGRVSETRGLAPPPGYPPVTTQRFGIRMFRFAYGPSVMFRPAAL